MSKVTKFANQAELAAARKLLSSVVVPPAPEFRPRFTREGLDSLINVLVNKTVASLRAREAAERQRK
jgi:hypothetical protein